MKTILLLLITATMYGQNVSFSAGISQNESKLVKFGMIGQRTEITINYEKSSIYERFGFGAGLQIKRNKFMLVPTLEVSTTSQKYIDFGLSTPIRYNFNKSIAMELQPNYQLAEKKAKVFLNLIYKLPLKTN